MKKIKNIFKLALLAITLTLSQVSMAQNMKNVKVGNNATKIADSAQFQVEGRDTTRQFVVLRNGNVGIGTIAPISVLQVSGAATNTRANVGSGTSIDFSLSNLAVTSNTGAAITLTNIKDGGAYTLAMSSTAASGTVTFTAAGFTFVEVGTVARTSGKKHLYNFIVVGTEVYVTMGTQN